MLKKFVSGGHVEKLLDYARGNFLVPALLANPLEELNEQLIQQCRTDLENRTRACLPVNASCWKKNAQRF